MIGQLQLHQATWQSLYFAEQGFACGTAQVFSLGEVRFVTSWCVAERHMHVRKLLVYCDFDRPAPRSRKTCASSDQVMT